VQPQRSRRVGRRIKCGETTCKRDATRGKIEFAKVRADNGSTGPRIVHCRAGVVWTGDGAKSGTTLTTPRLCATGTRANIHIFALSSRSCIVCSEPASPGQGVHMGVVASHDGPSAIGPRTPKSSHSSAKLRGRQKALVSGAPRSGAGGFYGHRRQVRSALAARQKEECRASLRGRACLVAESRSPLPSSPRLPNREQPFGTPDRRAQHPCGSK
jgi:hypothetical protein